MIIRILSEGQFEVPDAELDGLNELDAALESAVESGDEATLSQRWVRCSTGCEAQAPGRPSTRWCRPTSCCRIRRPPWPRSRT